MISCFVIAGLFTTKQKNSLQSNNARRLMFLDIINGQIVRCQAGELMINEGKYTPPRVFFPNFNSIAAGWLVMMKPEVFSFEWMLRILGIRRFRKIVRLENWKCWLSATELSIYNRDRCYSV